MDNNIYIVGDMVLLKNFRRKHCMGTVQQMRYNSASFNLLDTSLKEMFLPSNDDFDGIQIVEKDIPVTSPTKRTEQKR